MDDKKIIKNFIQKLIVEDIENGNYGGMVVTRFPPEPNGYLHIGHAKSICLNFSLAAQYGGTTHLRFDDTNPVKEDIEYIKSIEEDVRWLGFNWGDHLHYASDYFEKMYSLAVELIKSGKVYVDDLSAEEIREYRGTLTKPGKESPYRDRSVEENLDLFEKMKNGEFPDGSKTLRAKIDLTSGNINMRDPVMYRIVRADHPRQGDAWCIYPMYDWAHGLEDSIEGITHSICTLEFEDHRPLYDWYLDQFPSLHHPQQIEFARLNLTFVVMSKRKLLRLVKEGYVSGWDDPRMPTISGLRRRGYTPESIKEFSSKIGISKTASVVDYAFLEYCIREDLNKKATRRMAVLDPLKVIIDNYPEGEVEWMDGENNPEDPDSGSRKIPFTRELYIEKNDFIIDPPKKYFRLSPGKEIRLKHGYYVTCTDYKTDDTGEVTEVHCSYDPASRGGWTDDGRKVKGTSHWVSASHAEEIEVRMYGNLFTKENPEEDGDFVDALNPDSLTVIKKA
jgi:glutaminyl-tRNA synthetase